MYYRGAAEVAKEVWIETSDKDKYKVVDAVKQLFNDYDDVKLFLKTLKAVTHHSNYYDMAVSILGDERVKLFAMDVLEIDERVMLEF